MPYTDTNVYFAAVNLCKDIHYCLCFTFAFLSRTSKKKHKCYQFHS